MNTEEKILEIYENIKDNCVSIEQSGSSSLPFIEHSNDLDIMFVYDTEENANKSKQIFKKLYDRLTLRKEYNLDIHFISLEKDMLQHSYAYQIHFLKPLLNFKNALNVDILSNKEIYLNTLKRTADILSKVSNKYEIKNWYHIYIGFCFIENNKYELTDEQIINVNLLKTWTESENKNKLIDKINDKIKGE